MASRAASSKSARRCLGNSPTVHSACERTSGCGSPSARRSPSRSGFDRRGYLRRAASALLRTCQFSSRSRVATWRFASCAGTTCSAWRRTTQSGSRRRPTASAARHGVPSAAARTSQAGSSAHLRTAAAASGRPRSAQTASTRMAITLDLSRSRADPTIAALERRVRRAAHRSSTSRVSGAIVNYSSAGKVWDKKKMSGTKNERELF